MYNAHDRDGQEYSGFSMAKKSPDQRGFIDVR